MPHRLRQGLLPALVALALIACDSPGATDGPLTPPDDTPPEVTPPRVTPPDVDDPAVFAITALDPAEGVVAGLDEVQIYGSRLTDAVEVLFGESAAPEVFAINDELMVVLTPPRPEMGFVDVTIIDADGNFTTLARGFHYRTDVQVTLVEPAVGDWLGGESITVYGAGFEPGAKVIIGGAVAPVIDYVDQNTLTAVTPSGTPGAADLFVSTELGVAKYEAGFRYTGPPTIEIITPAIAPLAGGTELDITGTGFADAMTVTVGGRRLEQLEVVSATHLRGLTPAADVAGPVDVALVTDAGSAVAPGALIYLGADAGEDLNIWSVYPGDGSTAGGQLTTIVVSGMDAEGDVVVSVGGEEATVVTVDAEASVIVIRTPSSQSASTVDVTITQGAAEATLSGAFTYRSGAQITGIEPSTGPAAGGTTVIVTGSGFSDGASLRIGALPASNLRVLDATQIEATTPPGAAGPVDIRVLQDGAIATLNHAFTYDGEPAVWLVEPATGAVAGGTFVEIIGAGFPTTGTPEVLFGEGRATEVQIVDGSRIFARTPPGIVGPTAVTVRDADVTATHPNGFIYFDPSSVPGTWGGPVDGTVNVTVFDGRSGARLAGALVLLGPSLYTEHRGDTDVNGQITFSTPSLVGDQSVTASRSGYQTIQIAGFDAQNITVALQPIPTCEDIGDPPCDQEGGGPVAYFEGVVLDSTKGPSTPWGECVDWADAGGSLCQTCGSDAACGEGNYCGNLPGQGAVCTKACSVDADCGRDFICLDVTGADVNRQCVPPPGEVRVYCDITEPDMYTDPQAFPYPGTPIPAGDQTFTFETRLGNYAVYCWRGRMVRGFFRPEIMGVARHLGAFADGDVVQAEIRLNMPLTKRVAFEIDRPQMGASGQAKTTVQTFMNLNGDGVLEMPPLMAFEATRFGLKLPLALTGDMSDATYDISVSVEVEELSAISVTLETGIVDPNDDIDLKLGADGWELAGTLPETTRGIWGVDGDVLVVGDGGRIAKSFGEAQWARQNSGTNRDLHAIHVHPSGAAIAVGAGGTATHRKGLIWEPADTGVVSTLEGVWLAAADVAYAVGGHDLLRWDASGGWAPRFRAPAPLHAVYAPTPDDVWAVGDGGTVVRYEQGSFKTIEVPTGADLLGMAVDATTGELIAVGRGGVIVRLDGTPEVQTTPTASNLHGVWASTGDGFYAVGQRGTVLHRVDGAWEDVSNPAHRGTLMAVGGSGDKVWAMGSHEMVLGPMLAIPENLRPSDGNFLDDRLSWTVRPSIEPDFSLVDFDAQAGPCEVCGMFFMIPYVEWGSVLDGDLNEARFPGLGASADIFSFGLKQATIYRVLTDGPFDFDNTASNGFYNVGWKSFAARSAIYFK